MDTTTQRSAQTDDPRLFEALTQRPQIAWPTLAVLVAAFALFGLSTAAYLQGVLPLFWAITLNAIAAYLSFTPAHEASHNAVSTNRQFNEWVGRVAMVLQSPVPFFRTFRYIHMQHHRFTNHPARDPDMYVGSGPKWLLPFKWMTLDLNYFYYYISSVGLSTRPKSERTELYLAVVFGAIVLAATAAAGWLHYYLLLFFIPTRINAILLALFFDYLPHYPHQAQANSAPYQCTSNRVGMEWLLTPVLLYQNYHLVHHLYPTVPFYRYLKVWNAKKHYHQSQNPAITGAFSLNPSKAGEAEL